MLNTELGYKAKSDYSIYDFDGFPITIVFPEATIINEMEKMEQALEAGGYKTRFNFSNLTDAAISALVEKVLDCAGKNGIEVEDYGWEGLHSSCEYVAEATFKFPDDRNAFWFKMFMT